MYCCCVSRGSRRACARPACVRRCGAASGGARRRVRAASGGGGTAGWAGVRRGPYTTRAPDSQCLCCLFNGHFNLGPVWTSEHLCVGPCGHLPPL